MTNSIDNPFNYFTDAAGGALDAGKIYIGIAGLDPVANPITMYWDAELTITAAQPIRTSGGYPVYLGSAATLYADKSDYSIKVESAVDVLVYSSLNISKRVPAALVTYSQGGVGAVARTVESKLRESVSVKDFGAVGDGVTDNTAAILSALESLPNGGNINFSEGVYISNTKIAFALKGDTTLSGDNAVIKCTSSTIISNFFLITVAGYDLHVKGLIFDGNQKVNTLLRANESNQDIAEISVKDCTFKNSYTDSTTGNEGLSLVGGYNKAVVDNCTFKDHTRASGAGIPGASGTAGLTIAQTYLTNEHARFVSVQNCLFKNITNGDTGDAANNFDADGLKIFGGNATGTDYINATAVVSNNGFINCKGRAIKIQNDETTVIGNSIYRDISCIRGGSTEVNLQISSGKVIANAFHYEETSNGLSPFTSDGSAGPGTTVISFYTPSVHSRTRMITVSDNTIYNNVDVSKGYIQRVVDVSGYLASRLVAKVSGNNVSGKATCFIGVSPVPYGNAARIYLTSSSNYIDELEGSFIEGNGTGSYNENVFNLSGDVNAGSEVLAGLYPAGANTNLQANWSVVNCIGMTPVSQQKTKTPASFLSGIDNLSPASANGGILNIHSLSLANGATYTFPVTGVYSSFLLRIISVAASQYFTGIFVDGSTSVTDYSGGLSTKLSFTSTDPGSGAAVGKLHIYKVSGSELGCRNLIGSSRTITLVSIG